MQEMLLPHSLNSFLSSTIPIVWIDELWVVRSTEACGYNLQDWW